MTLHDLAYGQRVLWRNAAGRLIRAHITDIVHGHDEVQIRVIHHGGAQLLRVRPDALSALAAPTRAAHGREGRE